MDASASSGSVIAAHPYTRGQTKTRDRSPDPSLPDSVKHAPGPVIFSRTLCMTRQRRSPAWILPGKESPDGMSLTRICIDSLICGIVTTRLKKFPPPNFMSGSVVKATEAVSGSSNCKPEPSLV